MRNLVLRTVLGMLLLVYRLESFESYSHASQDKFVYTMLYDLLGKQDKGFYLEVGAGEPITINNTYTFEKDFNWSGVSIDISKDLPQRWYAVRKNTLLIEDATKTNYQALLKPFPKVIDYLSLDVDGLYVDVLKRIPFKDYTFKIITIEHDFYRFGDIYRSGERTFLSALGYLLLCPDVSDSGCVFEDWWVHPSFFSSSQLVALKSLDLTKKSHGELIKTLKSSLRRK